MTAAPLPAAETQYLAALTQTVQHLLGPSLVGVYLFGSAAYGAYEPGRSDLDVQAVVTEQLPEAELRRLAAALGHAALPCPARKLEFVLYTRAAVGTASRHPAFSLNLNTGAERLAADQPDHLTLDPALEAGHWFLLDIAAGRTLGRALIGPPASAVFAAPPRAWVLEALAASLGWHRQHEAATASSVMNACRAWRFAADGVWVSKQAGLAWARRQPATPGVRPATLDEALHARQHGGEVDREAALAFLLAVEHFVRQAPA